MVITREGENLGPSKEEKEISTAGGAGRGLDGRGKKN